MEEFERIKQQEEALIFDHFNSNDAWEIGNMLVGRAMKQNKAIAIRISMNRHLLFHYALDGTSPDNDNWVRRKENIVYYMGKSSYQVKLYLDYRQDTLTNKYSLDPTDYGASGGAVPIRVKDTGVVGAITVSGMAQEEDHFFAVNVMEEFLRKHK